MPLENTDSLGLGSVDNLDMAVVPENASMATHRLT